MKYSLCLLLACAAFAEVQEESIQIGKTKVDYKVVLPIGFDKSKTYPAVLAFGGGPQTMDVVNRTFERNWRAEAEKRGYIVISPAAPNGDLFFDSGDRIFPEFLTRMLAEYKVEGGKFHIAGMSNGGISSFHVAASHPQYFASITGFPGYLPQPTPARLAAISKMCISMYAGGNDPGWLQDMRDQAADFRKRGMKVRSSEEKGQPHMIATLTGAGAARLFDGFEIARNGCQTK